jgi:hypothetical protein
MNASSVPESGGLHVSLVSWSFGRTALPPHVAPVGTSLAADWSKVRSPSNPVAPHASDMSTTPVPSGETRRTSMSCGLEWVQLSVTSTSVIGPLSPDTASTDGYGVAVVLSLTVMSSLCVCTAAPAGEASASSIAAASRAVAPGIIRDLRETKVRRGRRVVNPR